MSLKSRFQCLVKCLKMRKTFRLVCCVGIFEWFGTHGDETVVPSIWNDLEK